MDIFHIDSNLKSYIYPAVKIFIFVLILLVLINRGHIIHIDNKIVNIIIGVLCTIVGIVCIYCTYISAFELFEVHGSRTKTVNIYTEAIERSEVYSTDEIVSLVKNNDIIEIRIISNDKIIKIGSSSDCKVGSSKFFNKLFYVDKKEFIKIEDFRDTIQLYSDSGQITVITIDGVSPKGQ